MPSVEQCETATSMTALPSTLELFDKFKPQENGNENGKESDSEESFHLQLDDDDTENQSNSSSGKNSACNMQEEAEDDILNKFDTSFKSDNSDLDTKQENGLLTDFDMVTNDETENNFNLNEEDCDLEQKNDTEINNEESSSNCKILVTMKQSNEDEKYEKISGEEEFKSLYELEEIIPEENQDLNEQNLPIHLNSSPEAENLEENDLQTMVSEDIAADALPPEQDAPLELNSNVDDEPVAENDLDIIESEDILEQPTDILPLSVNNELSGAQEEFLDEQQTDSVEKNDDEMLMEFSEINTDVEVPDNLENNMPEDSSEENKDMPMDEELGEVECPGKEEENNLVKNSEDIPIELVDVDTKFEDTVEDAAVTAALQENELDYENSTELTENATTLGDDCPNNTEPETDNRMDQDPLNCEFQSENQIDQDQENCELQSENQMDQDKVNCESQSEDQIEQDEENCDLQSSDANAEKEFCDEELLTSKEHLDPVSETLEESNDEKEEVTLENTDGHKDDNSDKQSVEEQSYETLANNIETDNKSPISGKSNEHIIESDFDLKPTETNSVENIISDSLQISEDETTNILEDPSQKVENNEKPSLEVLESDVSKSAKPLEEDLADASSPVVSNDYFSTELKSKDPEIVNIDFEREEANKLEEDKKPAEESKNDNKLMKDESKSEVFIKPATTAVTIENENSSDNDESDLLDISIIRDAEEDNACAIATAIEDQEAQDDQANEKSDEDATDLADADDQISGEDDLEDDHHDADPLVFEDDVTMDVDQDIDHQSDMQDADEVIDDHALPDIDQESRDTDQGSRDVDQELHDQKSKNIVQNRDDQVFSEKSRDIEQDVHDSESRDTDQDQLNEEGGEISKIAESEESHDISSNDATLKDTDTNVDMQDKTSTGEPKDKTLEGTTKDLEVIETTIDDKNDTIDTEADTAKDVITPENESINIDDESNDSTTQTKKTDSLETPKEVQKDISDKIIDTAKPSQAESVKNTENRKSSSKRTLSGDNDAKDQVSAQKKRKITDTISEDIVCPKKDENEKVKTLTAFAKYMQCKKFASKLSRSDLEQFCIQKICETFIAKSEEGELHHTIRKQEKLIENLRKDLQQLSKQCKDLEIVNKKLMNELRNQNTNKKPLVPLKITRSVGLQVRLNTANETSVVNNNNTRKRPATTPITPSPQKQPVPRLAPVSTTNSRPRVPSNPPQSPVVKQINPMPSPQKSPLVTASTTVQTSTAPPNNNLLSQALQQAPLTTIAPAIRRPTVAKRTTTPQRTSSNVAATIAEVVAKSSGNNNAGVIDLTDEDDKRPVMTGTVGGLRIVNKGPNGTTVAKTIALSKVVGKQTTVMSQGKGTPNKGPSAGTPTRVNLQAGVRLTPGSVINTSTAGGSPQMLYVLPSIGNANGGQKIAFVNLPTSLNGNAVMSKPITLKTAGPIRHKHPAPLPAPPRLPPDPLLKPVPPKPQLTIKKIDTGIILQWKMPYQLELYEGIASYQLYAYQETNAPPNTDMWRKVGDVKALALPMACTLTQFADKNKYYFAVRSVDVHKRIGAFSDPEEISL